MQVSENEIFFEFPKSAIRGIPILLSDKRICFGFIEIGCKPNHKRTQLRNKKELFFKYWADEYRKKFGIDWHPELYRILAHYDPTQNPQLEVKKSELDAIIFYEYITKEMIEDLDERDKAQIFNVVKSNKKRPILEEILNNNDAERLHNLIVSGGEFPELSALRGKMAEILVQKDIANSAPHGVNMYRNGDIKYFNKRYDPGTEIDGILTFYEESKLIFLLERLKTISYLEITDRFG